MDGDLVDETESEDEGGSGDGQLSFGGYTVHMEEVEEDEENNQFSSVLSTISWKQLFHIDGNFTIACRCQTCLLTPITHSLCQGARLRHGCSGCGLFRPRRRIHC